MNPPILEIVQNGYLEKLLNILDLNITQDSIVYEIVWIFINILYNNSDSTSTGFFVTPKAFRLWDKIISSGKYELIYNLMWLFTHVVDNQLAKEALVNSNLFIKIIEMLEAQNVNFLIIRNGIWLLSTISRGNNEDISNFEIYKRILNVLCYYFRLENQEIICDILFGLSQFSNTKYISLLKTLVDNGVVPYIINLSVNADSSLLTCALRIIGNIMTGDDLMVDEMINCNVIQFLEVQLKNSNANLRKEAVWCLSNIAAGTKNQIKALVESSAMEKVAELVRDPNISIVREAVWTISNCLSGSDLDLCIKFTSKGIMLPLIYVLVHQNDACILGIALEGLNQLFAHGQILLEFGGQSNPFVMKFIEEGGVEHLEKLQYHQNKEIFEYASKLVETYFNSQQI